MHKSTLITLGQLSHEWLKQQRGYEASAAASPTLSDFYLSLAARYAGMCDGYRYVCSLEARENRIDQQIKEMMGARA